MKFFNWHSKFSRNLQRTFFKFSKMYLFKLAFLTLLAGCCLSLTRAQLFSYKQLDQDSLLSLCEKNNVNLTELEEIHENVEDLLAKSIKPTKFPTLSKHCLGDSLKSYLQKEMSIVKKCINGTITLNSLSIDFLIDESEKKLCSLSKLASYDAYLGENCLNTTKSDECEMNILANTTMENSNEFANLGLGYTETGRENFEKLFDCVSTSIKTSCDLWQRMTRDLLKKDFIDKLKVTITSTTSTTGAEETTAT
ncbi:uncharacterized protein LOC127287872 [Leptopilina boulardi]|uniref:uncharacterized protein LOC127287872 n=1 Tax=Leptopilina boulardi TaxID=63433 RepID=UPI0021F5C6EF|nr:uncharacterized protein LOC127287872 [Leptopilina boulardi]